MRSLTLSDFAMGLDHLLIKNADPLKTLHASTIYEPALRAKHDEILIVFSKPTSSRSTPFGPELKAADGNHDDTATAFRYQLLSYTLHPATPADLRAAAQRLLDALASTPADLQRPYIDEVQTARSRRTLLPAHEADLRRFTTADGRTLYDWFTDQLAAAEQIQALLQQRVAAFASRKDLAEVEGSPGGQTLRTATLKLLTRFRKTVRDEMAVRSDLPRGLETQLFGYFDLLQSARNPS